MDRSGAAGAAGIAGGEATAPHGALRPVGVRRASDRQRAGAGGLLRGRGQVAGLLRGSGDKAVGRQGRPQGGTTAPGPEALVSAALPLEVERIRARFPALERRQDGRPVAYFDGPGGTQVPREVGEAMAEYLFHHNANTHWNYPTSAETDAALEAARATLADFLNAEPAEVVFGLNMTSLTFHL